MTMADFGLLAAYWAAHPERGGRRREASGSLAALLGADAENDGVQPLRLR